MNSCFGTFGSSNHQKKKKKLKGYGKTEDTNITRHELELRTRQRIIDEQNEKFLGYLLKAQARVENWSSVKIPNRRPRQKSEEELFPNFLIARELVPLNNCRKIIYLEFCPDDRAVQVYGRLSIVLLFDVAPKTCNVFVEHITKCAFQKPLPVTRIFMEVYMEFMILDPYMNDRLDRNPIPLSHSNAGTLSAMYVGRKFFKESYVSFTITFNPMPHLDGHRQVFGYVISGGELLRYMSTLGTKRGWKKEGLFLNKCGLVK